MDTSASYQHSALVNQFDLTQIADGSSESRTILIVQELMLTELEEDINLNPLH
jgi:hypothetical protein